jgi:hypothetical protein
MGLTVGGVIAILLIIIGIIMLIIGIILFERDVSNKVSSQWYVWLLLIGGLILAIIGGIWLVYDLRKHNTIKVGIPGSTSDAGEISLQQQQQYSAMVPQQNGIQYVAQIPQQEIPATRVVYTSPTAPVQGQQASFAGYGQHQGQQVYVPSQTVVSNGLGQ